MTPVATLADEWIEELRDERPEAVARLHDLLLRAARYEVRRRGAGDRDDLAVQAAGDALVAVLRKLDTFRGESRFTTWAYKFALYEAAVAVRRQAWRGREVELPAELPFAGPSPASTAESAELLEAVQRGIREALTDRQREVLLALTVAEVPIDVLADRLQTTRGALYKMLHDARQKLRAYLADEGLMP